MERNERSGMARLAAVLLAMAMVVLATSTSAAATSWDSPVSPEPYPVADFGEGLQAWFDSPDSVPGVNVWPCQPRADRPYPVLLVHATVVNLGSNWRALGPMLANDGYCVYGYSYGYTFSSNLGGMDDVEKSALKLAEMVDFVLAMSGADKVHIVGHSQGGMLPNYYLKFLGGADKVESVVGIGPNNHGTTLSGLVTLGATLQLLGIFDDLFTFIGTPAFAQQREGSAFFDRMNALPDTVPGVTYSTINTKYDWVITPYQSGFLHGPNVRNHVIQDYCSDNTVSHVGLAYDWPTLQLVMNELDGGNPHFVPECTNYGPPL